jgi:hypothetical protein
LEIRKLFLNANNAFKKIVVSTHNIFMLSDLVPTVYIHGCMGIYKCHLDIHIHLHTRFPNLVVFPHLPERQQPLWHFGSTSIVTQFHYVNCIQAKVKMHILIISFQ